MDYLKIAKEYYLNLIEVSILIYLIRAFPNSASIEEMTCNEVVYLQVQKGLDKLIEKELVSKVNQKYKIQRDILIWWYGL